MRTQHRAWVGRSLGAAEEGVRARTCVGITPAGLFVFLAATSLGWFVCFVLLPGPSVVFILANHLWRLQFCHEYEATSWLFSVAAVESLVGTSKSMFIKN